MQTEKSKLLIMQETKIYEWLKSFCTGGHGWEFLGKPESGCEMFITRTRKKTVYRQESGRRIKILKIHGLVDSGVAAERVPV